MTTFQEARDVIQDHFSSGWASETPIAWENVAFTPPAASDWVRLFIRNDAGFQASFGAADRRFRRLGQLTIEIFVPENSGLNSAIQLAERAVDLFDGVFLLNGAIRFRNTSLKEVGNDGAGWYQINVLADFSFDEFK